LQIISSNFEFFPFFKYAILEDRQSSCMQSKFYGRFKLLVGLAITWYDYHGLAVAQLHQY